MARAQWTELMAHYRTGAGLPHNHFLGVLLAAVVEGQSVGRASIRFEFVATHAVEGGYIGHVVMSAFRRRGYATAILEEALVIDRSVGVDAVLLTCKDHNVASATVNERCGGVLKSIASDENGEALRRYWL